jgi:hypothetical protein
MLSRATRALIWVPGPLTWNVTNFVVLSYYSPIMIDWTPSDQHCWHDDLHHDEEPAYIMKDLFETPGFLTYLNVLLNLVALVASNRRSTQHFKTQLLSCLFATTLIIRCLSSFAGGVHYTESVIHYILPWNPTSPWKRILLELNVQLWL